MGLDKDKLDELYIKFNNRNYISPDPLQFLYDYPEMRDREIVGIIASSLAYGRVNQILKACSLVLNRLGEYPYDFVVNSSPTVIKKRFVDFRYRFTNGKELAELLIAIRKVIREFGSINEAMLSFISEGDENIYPAMVKFLAELYKGMDINKSSLLPIPVGKSANKRLNLYFRWLIRKDAVDPGGWVGIAPSMLIIPLDTHMLKIGRIFGLTNRKIPDITSAIEITSGFKKIEPEDPTKYDFVLTRFGIRNDMNMENLILYFRVWST